MSNKSNSNRVVVRSLVILTQMLVLFVALKILGIIGWSWLCVLAPAWIPVAAVVAGVVLLLVVALVVGGCAFAFGLWRGDRDA